MRTLGLAALLALALSLTGCGDDDSDTKADGSTSDGVTSTTTDDAPTDAAEEEDSGYPDCGDIWVIGQTLPDDFEGCLLGDTITSIAGLECSDGSHLYVLEDETTGEDAFYGVTGQTIGDATDDAAYGEAYDACAG